MWDKKKLLLTSKYRNTRDLPGVSVVKNPLGNAGDAS